MKIKKGDKVKVIAGKDKGVVAEVIAVLPRLNKVVVEGVNVHKLHQKPSNENPDGGIVNKEAPIAISNVKLAEGKKAAKKTTAKKAEKKPAAKKEAAKKTTKKAVKGDKK